MKRLLCVVLALLSVLIFAGCKKKTDVEAGPSQPITEITLIDTKDYLSVQYTGGNGYATAKLIVNTNIGQVRTYTESEIAGIIDYMAYHCYPSSDYVDESGETSEGSLARYREDLKAYLDDTNIRHWIVLSLDKTEDLSNSDVLSLKGEVSSELQSFGLKTTNGLRVVFGLSFSGASWNVSGLRENTTIDVETQFVQKLHATGIDGVGVIKFNLSEFEMPVVGSNAIVYEAYAANKQEEPVPGLYFVSGKGSYNAKYCKLDVFICDNNGNCISTAEVLPDQSDIQITAKYISNNTVYWLVIKPADEENNVMHNARCDFVNSPAKIITTDLSQPIYLTATELIQNYRTILQALDDIDANRSLSVLSIKFSEDNAALITLDLWSNPDDAKQLLLYNICTDKWNNWGWKVASPASVGKSDEFTQMVAQYEFVEVITSDDIYPSEK